MSACTVCAKHLNISSCVLHFQKRSLSPLWPLSDVFWAAVPLQSFSSLVLRVPLSLIEHELVRRIAWCCFQAHAAFQCCFDLDWSVKPSLHKDFFHFEKCFWPKYQSWVTWNKCLQAEQKAESLLMVSLYLLTLNLLLGKVLSWGCTKRSAVDWKTVDFNWLHQNQKHPHTPSSQLVRHSWVWEFSAAGWMTDLCKSRQSGHGVM